MRITAKQAIDSLQKVVEGKEDFVYQGTPNGACFYYDFNDKRPSCGVGYALIDLGVDPSAFEGNLNTRKITCLPLGEDIDFNARLVFESFQANQDEKMNWGASLEAAYDTYVELMQQEEEL